MFKIFILSALVAVAFAQHFDVESDFEHGGFEHGGFEHGGHDEDHDTPSHYSFEYSVHDSKTGDVKQAKESREGDVVKGFYTLKEADGSTREVHYTADKHNGFSAQVTRSGHGFHSQQSGHDFY